MNAAALQLALTIFGQVPMRPPTPVQPAEPPSPAYFEFLEQNSHVIYPALAILVLVLLVAGILQAWRSHELDAQARAELKREVMHELRRQRGGSPAEVLARALGLESFKLVRLLEEMQRDGLVVSHTNTSRLTVWRIKGTAESVSGAAPAKRRSSRSR